MRSLQFGPIIAAIFVAALILGPGISSVYSTVSSQIAAADQYQMVASR